MSSQVQSHFAKFCRLTMVIGACGVLSLGCKSKNRGGSPEDIQVTASCDGGFASVTVTNNTSEPIIPSSSTIGADYTIYDLLIDEGPAAQCYCPLSSGSPHIGVGVVTGSGNGTSVILPGASYTYSNTTAFSGCTAGPMYCASFLFTNAPAAGSGTSPAVIGTTVPNGCA